MAYNKVTVKYSEESGDVKKRDVDPSVATLTITLSPIHSGWLVEYGLWLESEKFHVEAERRQATLQLAVRSFAKTIPSVCVPKKDGVIVFIKGANAQADYNDGGGEWCDLEGTMKVFINEGRFWLHLESPILCANIPCEFKGYAYPEVHKDLAERLMNQSGITVSSRARYAYPSAVLGEYTIASVDPG